MARLVSSRVRTEIRHATSISNADVWPSSYNWNSIAFGNGCTASRMRSTATSMSKGCFATRPVLETFLAYRWFDSTQASFVDVAHDRLDVGLFDGQVVQAVAGGDVG